MVYIYDSKHSLVASGKCGEIEIPNAMLWSAESPYLYTCEAKSDTDCVEQKFGIRLISWSAQDGLCINGESIKLRGGCIHHDNGVLGALRTQLKAGIGKTVKESLQLLRCIAKLIW